MRHQHSCPLLQAAVALVVLAVDLWKSVVVAVGLAVGLLPAGATVLGLEATPLLCSEMDAPERTAQHTCEVEVAVPSVSSQEEYGLSLEETVETVHPRCAAYQGASVVGFDGFELAADDLHLLSQSQRGSQVSSVLLPASVVQQIPSIGMQP